MHEKLGIGADNINDHTAPSLTDSFDELFEFPYIFWPQKKIKFQFPELIFRQNDYVLYVSRFHGNFCYFLEFVNKQLTKCKQNLYLFIIFTLMYSPSLNQRMRKGNEGSCSA